MSTIRLTGAQPAGIAAARCDVLLGLRSTPKTLPPRWLYDALGSDPFEQVTGPPQYHPAHIEREILRSRAADIAVSTDARTLVELGPGAPEKRRYLLDALPGLHTYVGANIDATARRQAGPARTLERPDLSVHALVAGRASPRALFSAPGRRLVTVLGGVFGALLPAEQATFLDSVRNLLADGDMLLLGVDLLTDPAAHLAGYDDPHGTTAALNKRVVHALNRELGADFDPDTFEHAALWNAAHERVEMRLRSCIEQTVKLPALDLALILATGEELHTEVAAKFRQPDLLRQLSHSGLELQRWFATPAQRCGLALVAPRVRPSAGHVTTCVR
ncbi:L-histidine N(alpha)-methyltransferase [Streptomyces sp. NPDC058371]|uniref:L-histidine N(alpha)-methyltransferase n=1 Tax=Streptomyces sp. NPDC058371 TaxID=3346463 RepID=UPI00365F75D8